LTRDIALRIAVTLLTHGSAVDVRSVEDIPDFDPYDAVVFGSGVYDGSWTPEATDLSGGTSRCSRESVSGFSAWDRSAIDIPLWAG